MGRSHKPSDGGGVTPIHLQRYQDLQSGRKAHRCPDLIFYKGIAMQSDSNEQERVVLCLLLSILVLLIGGVLGLGVLKAKGATVSTTAGVSASASASASALTNSAAVAAPDNAGVAQVALSASDASVVVDANSVAFYFATGSAELASGAGAALGDAVAAAKAGRFVVLSGFHDETGDAAFNAELAKRRAMAVRASLLMAGAPEDRVVMREPEVLTGTGSNAQARRVDVVISGNMVQ